MSSNHVTIGPDSIRSLNVKEITPELQKGKSRQRHRRICFYKGHPYLLDPKDYIRDDDPEGDRAVENTTDLVSLLQSEHSDELGTLQCRGWFEDQGKEQIYFVFHLPDGCSEKSTFCTLLDYLATSRPSVTARMNLAVFLATSILQIHQRGYFHKGIRSDSLVFFQRAPTDERSLENPRLAGFDFSRKANPGKYSEKDYDTNKSLYRHPDALLDPDTNFSELHDYYSLGVVLVEIALWKPIKDVLQRHQSLQGAVCDEAEAMKIRGILLGDDPDAENHPREIAFHVGDRYTDVVELCLRGSFGRSLVRSALWNEFNKRVVCQLKECVI